MSEPMKAPERSTATEVMTTTIAVIAILNASSYQNKSSGEIIRNEHPRHSGRAKRMRLSARPGMTENASLPFQADLDRRSAADRLIDDAIALGELEQLVELVLRHVGGDVEAQANLRQGDRRLLGDAERAAKIEIAFGRHRAGFERHVDRGRDRLERHAGAGDQSFEQHVARAQFHPGAAGRRMQS